MGAGVVTLSSPVRRQRGFLFFAEQSLDLGWSFDRTDGDWQRDLLARLTRLTGLASLSLKDSAWAVDEQVTSLLYFCVKKPALNSIEDMAQEWTPKDHPSLAKT